MIRKAGIGLLIVSSSTWNSALASWSRAPFASRVGAGQVREFAPVSEA